MSANEMKVGIVVSDGGTTKNVIKDASQLRMEYDGVARAATAASKAMATSTEGSRKAAQSSREYGALRGAAGATGASARNFANEAQGLGGLVRLYATYAANVFAVGAAFRALRDAAGTELISRGLEQMGVAGGRSLRGLSSEILKLTDGAISLRDAMKSVAQASSSGLGAQQIRDLTVVANKASNALGVDMADAINRITRGVTKLEPELLDELGLFTKIGPAVDNYALKTGKAVSALSDFERRQAFANAVIEEGKRKFDSIAAAGNPYDKLAASLTNLATNGLNVVNKVLEPIARILAESPTGLTAVITLLGVKLLGSALPALGQWRKTLSDTAKESAIKAKEINTSFSEMLGQKDAAKLDQALKPLRERINSQLADVQTGIGKILRPTSEAVKYALSGAVDADVLGKKLDTIIKKREQGLNLSKQELQSETDPKKLQSLTTSVTKREQELLVLQQKRDMLRTIAVDQAAYNIQEDRALDAKLVWYKDFEAWSRQKQAERTTRRAIGSNILSEVNEDTQRLGISGAFENLNRNIKDGIPQYDKAGNKISSLSKGLTGLSAATTFAKGAFLILGTAITTTLAVVAPYLEVFGLLVVGYNFFSDSARNAVKQQEDFDSAISSTDESIRTATKTLELYRDKKKDVFSTEAITAFSTSISGVADSLFESNKAFNNWTKSANAWDKFKDWHPIWGTSNLDKVRQETAAAVSEITKTLQFSGTSGTRELQVLASSLGISTNDLVNKTDAYKKSIEGLPQSKLISIATTLVQIAEREKSAAQSAVAFGESLQEIDKIVTEIGNSTQFNSLEGKLGVSLVQASDKLNLALQDPIKSFDQLSKLAKDPKLTAVLGIKPSIAGPDVKELSTVASNIEVAQQIADKWLQKNRGVLDAQGKALKGAESALGKQAEAVYRNLVDNVSRLKGEFKGLQEGIVSYVKQQQMLVTKLAEKGLEYQKKALKYAQEQAGITVGKARAGALSSAGVDTARMEYGLTIQEINIQEKLTTSNINLQKAVLDNTIALQDLTTVQQYQQAQKDLSNPDATVRANAKILVEALEPAFGVAMGNLLKGKAPEDRSLSYIINSSEAQNIRRGRQAQYTQIDLQLQAQQAASGAQRQVAGITLQTKEADQALRNTQERLALENQTISTQQQKIRLAQEVSGITSTELINEEAILELTKISNDYESKLAAISRDRSVITQNTTDFTNKAVINRLAELDAQERQLKKERDLSKLQTEFTALQKTQTQESAEYAQKQELVTGFIGVMFERQQSTLQLEQERLNILTQYTDITQEEAAKQKAALDQRTADLNYSKEYYSLATQQKDLQLKILQSKEKEALLASSPEALALQQQVTAGLTNQGTLLNTRITQLTDQKTKTDELLAQQTSWNLLTAKQADETKKVTDLTNSLAGAFGEVGQSIGEMVDSLVKATQQFEVLEKLRKDQTITEEEYQKKSKLWALDTINSTSKAFKKQMGEKTVGYKILTGVEKAAAAASAVIRIMELKDTVAKAIATVSANAPAIISQFLAQLGPLGWGLGVAAVAALGGAFSGGSGPGFVMSSEQRQETQGTGLTYVDDGTGQGTLVATGKSGVWGDIAAKSNSIDNTLSRMETNQVEGLTQDTKLLKAFKDLGTSFQAVAANLPSFKTSVTGAETGTATDPGFFGLFSSTTTTEIIDSGIQLKGTFLELALAVGGTSNLFEKIKTTVTDNGFFGLFGGTSTDVQTITRELGAKTTKSITEMFAAGAVAFGEVTRKAGVSDAAALDALNKIDLTGQLISLKGKSGEEVAKELQSIMSSYLDDAAAAVFEPTFGKFRKFGEGFLETVTRVIDTNDKVAQSLANLGNTTKGLQGLYEVTEALAEKAGGLDKFTSQYNFFIDNFLTDTERLAISQSAVNKELTRLNLTSIKTKTQFKDYVRALDLTIPAQQDLYTSLMALAPAFYEVADAAEKSLKATIDQFKNFSKSLRDFRDNLLLGSTSTLTPQQKYEESRRQFESTYMSALSGDKDAQGKLSSVANSFLEASKTYNASSGAYTQDFNNVLDKVTNAISYSEAQVSAADLQLTESQAQTTILSSIDKAVSATASILNEAKTGVSGAYTASGITSPTASTAALSSTAGTSSSSSVAPQLSEEQNRFFDFLDSKEGSIFKDIRGQALGNAVLPVIGAVTPGVAGILMSAAGKLTENKNALTVAEADALAREAMDTPELQQAIERAIESGVSQDKISNILVTIRDTMKREAKDTSFIGDILGNGNGNRDAAKRALATIVSDLGDAAAIAIMQSTTPDSEDDNGYSSSSWISQVTNDGNYSGTYYSPEQSKYGMGAYASGGYASGLSIVGENGPELVDFSTPGRVYTAEETFGMFNGINPASQDLVREIRELRKEVQNLREQQHEETAVLVSAAFDAQKENADRVSDSLSTTAENAAWNLKLQNSVKLV